MDVRLQDKLLSLARAVLENKLLDSGNDLSIYQESDFEVPRGLFVTLEKSGALRGCIGRIEPGGTIYDNVIELAESAAFHDGRFKPLTAKELSQTTIEISLLTLPEEVEGVTSWEKIIQLRPNIDGVIIRANNRNATFLPQVWESLTSHERFISELCRKAGLSKEYWKANEMEILRYQAEHFQEPR